MKVCDCCSNVAVKTSGPNFSLVVQKFDDGGAGFTQEAAFGPEVTDVGCDWHARLAELFVKDTCTRLVRFLVIWGDARTLRVDDKLTGVCTTLFHIRFHLFDGLPTLPATR